MLAVAMPLVLSALTGCTKEEKEQAYANCYVLVPELACNSNEPGYPDEHLVQQVGDQCRICVQHYCDGETFPYYKVSYDIYDFQCTSQSEIQRVCKNFSHIQGACCDGPHTNTPCDYVAP